MEGILNPEPPHYSTTEEDGANLMWSGLVQSLTRV